MAKNSCRSASFSLFLALNVVFDHGWRNLILLSDHFLQKKKKEKQQMAKSALLIWSFHMRKNSCHFAKLQGIVLRLIGVVFITPNPHIPEATPPCSRTHRIQAAGTRCCSHRVLDHWRRTGYWGSCDSAGPPYYTRWPGGSPYPALSCGNRKRRKRLCQEKNGHHDVWQLRFLTPGAVIHCFPC